MNKSERLQIIEQFNKKSLSFDINDQLPYALIAQCTSSYHQFIAALMKDFGFDILVDQINVTVEIEAINIKPPFTNNNSPMRWKMIL